MILLFIFITHCIDTTSQYPVAFGAQIPASPCSHLAHPDLMHWVFSDHPRGPQWSALDWYPEKHAYLHFNVYQNLDYYYYLEEILQLIKQNQCCAL